MAIFELQRIISSIRSIMQVPDCVELYNSTKYNLYENVRRIFIVSDTIRKVFDCLIRPKVKINESIFRIRDRILRFHFRYIRTSFGEGGKLF